MRGSLARELAAEFFGTFILIVFGVAVVAQVVFGQGDFGDTLSINFGWGVAVTMGVFAAGGITGAHINPAVTLALAVHRQFPWKKVIPYSLAQTAGAFAASAVVYVTYYDALQAFDGGTRVVVGPHATAGIWATYPQAYLTTGGGFIDQVVGTALLVALVLAISDQKNLAPPANMAPLFIGAIVFLIGMTFGVNCGYAINPARDFGPRLFTFLAGWGSEVFTAYDYWWWVPIVGPLVGGVIGGFVYDFFITRFHPKEDSEG